MMGSRSNNGGGVGGKQQLWILINDKTEELLERMNANSKMLGSLSKSGLISRADERKLEGEKVTERRNAELLQMMLENESKVPDAFDKFIDALNASDQKKLASTLVKDGNHDDRNGRRPASPSQSNDKRRQDDRNHRDDGDRNRENRNRDDRNRDDRNRDDGNPGKHKQSQNKSYVDVETRRTNSKTGAPATGSHPSRSRSMGDRNGETSRRATEVDDDRGSRPQQQQQQRNRSVSPDRTGRHAADDTWDQRNGDDFSTSRRRDDFDHDTGEHPEHSQKVINKLRKDCEEVAKKNAYLIDRLRQVEALLSKVNPAGVGSSRDNLSRDGASGNLSTRSDETEHYASKIRDHVTAITADKNDSDQQLAACEAIVEKLRNEIAERNMALVNLDENEEAAFRQRKWPQPLTPTSANQSPLPATTHQISSTGGVVNGLRASHAGQLRSKIANLSAEMDAYVHREKQHTMIPRWPGREPGPHRNFDQVDHDFNVLMRELRQNDRHSSMQSIQRLADVTKTEREDCIRICDDIQRLVQKRRTKIQELLQQYQKQISGASRKNEQVVTSPVLQRKVRTTRSVESNVSRRLVELGDEIKLCIEYEFDYNQKVRDDFARRRLDFDERQRSIALDVKRLERRAKEAETERDRYRRLYEQAQVVQLSRLLTKPTVVNRTTGKKNGRRANTVPLGVGLSLPTINRYGDEDPIPSKSLFVSTSKKKNKRPEDENNNDDDDDDDDDKVENDRNRLRRSEPVWYNRQSELDNDDGRHGDRGYSHPNQLQKTQQQQHQVAVHLQTRPVQNDSDHRDRPAGYNGYDRSPSPRSPSGDPHRVDDQRRGHSPDRLNNDASKGHKSQKQRDDDHAGDRRDGNGYHGNGHPDDGRWNDNRQSNPNEKNHVNGHHGNGQSRPKGIVRTVMDVVDDY